LIHRPIKKLSRLWSIAKCWDVYHGLRRNSPGQRSFERSMGMLSKNDWYSHKKYWWEGRYPSRDDRFVLKKLVWFTSHWAEPHAFGRKMSPWMANCHVDGVLIRMLGQIHSCMNGKRKNSSERTLLIHEIAGWVIGKTMPFWEIEVRFEPCTFFFLWREPSPWSSIKSFLFDLSPLNIHPLLRVDSCSGLVFVKQPAIGDWSSIRSKIGMACESITLRKEKHLK
jgi:hypothetical protein